MREFCDRVILIEDSRIVAEGGADYIAEEYTKLFRPVVAQAKIPPGAPLWGLAGRGERAVHRVRVPQMLDEDAEGLVWSSRRWPRTTTRLWSSAS